MKFSGGTHGHLTNKIKLFGIDTSHFTKKGINILFSQGYHTVFNDDDICCGILFEDDVEEYVEENDCDYEEAFDILSEKLAKEYKEELKNEKVKENLQ